VNHNQPSLNKTVVRLMLPVTSVEQICSTGMKNCRREHEYPVSHSQLRT